MSLDASQWAWRQRVKPSMKIILLALADRANEHHQCFPSISRLEYDTGLNRKTIMSSLRVLSSDDVGLVRIEKGKSKNGQFLRNRYTLIGVKNRHDSEPDSGAWAGDDPYTKNGTRDDENPVPVSGHGPCPKNGQNHVPKTDKTMSQKRDTNLPVNLSINLPNYIRASLFTEFIGLRKKLKAVNSDHSMKLILTELEKIRAMGQDPNKAIERSIMNSWKSVYPEKVSYETRRRNGETESNHARVTRVLQEQVERG